jgi:hypothetical protein
VAAWLLTVLLVFWGVGAVGGGFFLASAPDGSGMGFDPALLDGTPFPDFLVPGLILFGLGVAAVLTAVVLVPAIRRQHLSKGVAWWVLLVALGINAWIFGEILFLWTAVQELPALDQRFFYTFWAVYVPLSLAIAAFAVRVTRDRLGRA